jgi:hypothetical protein
MASKDEVLGKVNELLKIVKEGRSTNPKRPVVAPVGNPGELVEKLDELIKAVKEQRTNPPTMVQVPMRTPVEEFSDDERSDLSDDLEEVQESLDAGRVDRAQEILDEILEGLAEDSEEVPD